MSLSKSPILTYSVLSACCLLSISFSTYAADMDSLKTNKIIIDNQKLASCLDNLAQTSSFLKVKDTFTQYRPTKMDPSVIKALNYQPEFSKEPWDYLASLVDKERVIDGIAASDNYADILTKIESQYGVSRYDVLGVWGVESDFGTTLGKKDVINSLATLSCFGRRQNYFRGEYVSALKILQQGDIAKSDFNGSWAGAFGQTQFMPSTFLRLAQDFDSDGRKDLVNSKADALASTANFLNKSGYKSHQPWGYEVQLPSNGNFSNNRKNKRPISYWRNLGVTLTDGTPLPDTLSSVGLLLPSGKLGPAFLVGRNFDAFYSYNASENYALAIAHLSERIKQRNTIVSFSTAWPTDDPGLSRKESREVQESLNLLGYNIGEVDGIIGDKTRQAIQKYQSDIGRKADGKAGKKIHQQLMISSAKLRETASLEAKMDTNTKVQAAANDSLNNTNQLSSETKYKYGLFGFMKSKTLLFILIGLLAALIVVILIRKKR